MKQYFRDLHNIKCVRCIKRNGACAFIDSTKHQGLVTLAKGDSFEPDVTVYDESLDSYIDIQDTLDGGRRPCLNMMKLYEFGIADVYVPFGDRRIGSINEVKELLIDAKSIVDDANLGLTLGPQWQKSIIRATYKGVAHLDYLCLRDGLKYSVPKGCQSIGIAYQRDDWFRFGCEPEYMDIYAVNTKTKRKCPAKPSPEVMDAIYRDLELLKPEYLTDDFKWNGNHHKTFAAFFAQAIGKKYNIRNYYSVIGPIMGLKNTYLSTYMNKAMDRKFGSDYISIVNNIFPGYY